MNNIRVKKIAAPVRFWYGDNTFVRVHRLKGLDTGVIVDAAANDDGTVTLRVCPRRGELGITMILEPTARDLIIEACLKATAVHPAQRGVVDGAELHVKG